MDHLAVAVTKPDGIVYRWGGDEPDARNVPESITFGTSMPGGFATATITLQREVDLDWPDLDLYDDVRIYGPGNATAYEGRIMSLPRSDGDSEFITVGCVGWVAHLRDDATFTEIYVDRDITRWHEPPLARRVRVVVTLNQGYGQSFEVSVGARAMRFDSKTQSQIDINERSERWYTMPKGKTATKMVYRGIERNTASIVAAGVDGTDDEDGDPTTAYGHTLDDTLRTVTITTPVRYLNLRAQASANVNKTAGAFSRTYKLLAVYGDHGLTTYDGDDTSDAQGVVASDVVRHAVARAAPLLSTRGVTDSTFVIPHLIFPDPTTAADVIEAVNAFDLWDYGVYEDRDLFFRQPDPARLTWEARRSDGAVLDLEGAAGDELYNGVVVVYTNTIGEPKTVGPVGSNCDDEDDVLLDATSTNPVNSHGIPRRYFRLELTQIHSLSGAKRLGKRWLEEQRYPQRRGTLAVAGTILHPTAGAQPVWKVRAGDYVRVTDHSADVARRIVETDYDHDSRTNTLSLDNSRAGLDAILEQVAAILGGQLGTGKGKAGRRPRQTTPGYDKA